MGSDTTASTMNLNRHRVLATQYANGSPITSRINVVRVASRTLSQIASQSITCAREVQRAAKHSKIIRSLDSILRSLEAIAMQDYLAIVAKHKVAQCIGGGPILSPTYGHP